MGVIALGILVLAAGIFFLPAPGPGFIVIALGGAILARESLIAAKALDWCELRVRSVLSWAQKVWRDASTPVRAVIVIAAAALAAAAAYVAWRVLFS